MSDVEYRRLRPEEVPDISGPLQQYAFFSGPPSREEIAKSRESIPHESIINLVAFDKGTPAAVVVGIPMRQNLRGSVVPMLGIAGVATHPNYRRKGYVRRLLDRLHGECRDEGHVTAGLWPFRPSFYERFGYASFPKEPNFRLYPEGLQVFRKLDLPGEITLHRLDESIDEILPYLHRKLGSNHGFALFDDARIRDRMSKTDAWVAFSRTEQGITGMLTYRSEGFGNALSGDHLHLDDPTARALFLQWFAVHADQFGSFTFTLPSGEKPDVWYTDITYDADTKIGLPTRNASMARILSVEGLSGIAVGDGQVTVEVADDQFVSGTWTLSSNAGTLEVRKGGTPTATLTANGLAALVYGLQDPDEIGLRGYGSVEDESTAGQLRTLFPAAEPTMFTAF